MALVCQVLSLEARESIGLERGARFRLATPLMILCLSFAGISPQVSQKKQIA